MISCIHTKSLGNGTVLDVTLFVRIDPANIVLHDVITHQYEDTATCIAIRAFQVRKSRAQKTLVASLRVVFGWR